ncbi:FHA domain-containing protein [Gryllotalpicola sp.]|uniref:FHA domain-containing protein FhaB/FipA n=1 Tax=Gryllotalpicola sp. TaxID=1932787 RepID=UPI00261D0440|nr:FHA domain-containing protein [Gryllotalpicola sp.]
MNVSELTLLVLRVGFLVLLWVFVFVIVYALRGDLFGSRVRKLPDAGASAPPIPPMSSPEKSPPASGDDDGTNSLAGLARDQTGEQPWLGSPAAATTSLSGGYPVKATRFTAGRLTITSGPLAGHEIELTPDPLTIGRSSDSGLILHDDYTSTHHARIMLWNDEWMLQDLDSTNGTFLDGRRVTSPTPIPLDTPIRIGLTTFELRRA